MGLHPGVVGNERRRRGIEPVNPRRTFEWSDDMIALLGTDSDRAIGERLGLPSSTVARKRWVLGIPSYYPSRSAARGFRWQARHLALLGTMTDREVARRIGISKTTVAEKRSQRGIPAFLPPPPRIEWTADKIERLGKLADSQIARELDVCTLSVRLKRQALGIAASRESRPISRNASAADLLGRPNQEIVRATGLDAATIRRLREDLGIDEPIVTALRRSTRRRASRSGSATRARESDGAAGQAPTGRRGCRWRVEEIALLGSAPDVEIGALLGRSTSAVTVTRRHAGILTRPAGQPWRPEEIALLGTAPDPQIAARLGRTVPAVWNQRKQLGVPAWRNPSTWPEEEIALLGTMPDAEVAVRLGRPLSAVGAKRHALGISPADRAGTWRREEIALLGTAPDAEVAARLGRTLDAVELKRQRSGIAPVLPEKPDSWSEAEIALLGSDIDLEVAARVGRSHSAVTTKRLTLGIAPSGSPKAWRAGEIALLGTAGDSEIALRLGRTVNSVALKRGRLGIPAFRPTSG